ncbi:heavy metal translocating P-type ATPase [Campylobacter corcagiensis]|uniref:Copper-transporting ATPase n=1 Tax=Campylobacter corcagiensis TaxID=1448857 RepID=A0A7M1LHQ2_9BACT|nr:cation-translocating P-type ATPase [Campylobacter corcagiensis]QKF64813.1 copper-translocating P-type ATPase [Campylobacter corcagiensis]QOQ87025.1 cation-translocating P-type ATPase [Campylobacter corcagiensis]
MSKRLTLNIVGMSCVNCSNAIQRAVKKIDGVVDANVNFSSGEAIFDVKSLKLEDIIKTKIEKLGFEVATDYEELNQKKLAHLKKLKFKLILAAFLTLIIIYLHMIATHSYTNSLAQLILSFIVVFYCGSDFFSHAISALKNRNFDMNVLVSLGSFSAFAFSTFVFLFPNLVIDKFHTLYFESASMIISFILFGRFLENSSKAKANSHIKALLDLTPKTALLVKSDGTTEEILAKDLKIGDVFMVKSGMNIPRDGVILHGATEINAAILTGESMPIYKKIGDMVNAGCLNTNGVINVRVTTEVHETLLARITRLLSQTTAKKMPIARMADKVANIFVPAVILLSILTFLVWFLSGNSYYGIMCAISVLVISCPCALGLAVPIAIVCAVSNLAKNGVLVKNPEVLEIAKDTKTLIFDKTGTLTTGEISVSSTNLSDEILTKLASAELLSEHLIAKAIVNFANKKGLKFSKFDGEFESVVGRGLKADKLIVGNLEFLNKNGIFDINESEFSKFIDKGDGIILVAYDKEYKGYVALSDTLRDSSKELLNTLKDKKSVMITGDSKKTADFVGKSLGIDEIYSSALPEDKLNLVKNYENSIFVGDGVNDALSLKSATIGASMNSGSDIAKGAGDILLVNNDLMGVAKFINTSTKSVKVIKQNLFWAFFYNALCIPIATGALYPLFGILLEPHFAALAMSFSSVTVVLNSLRLYSFKS